MQKRAIFDSFESNNVSLGVLRPNVVGEADEFLEVVGIEDGLLVGKDAGMLDVVRREDGSHVGRDDGIFNVVGVKEGCMD